MSLGPYSFETGEKKTFVAADYAVVGCTMAVSVAIGIFFAIKDRNRNTPDEYLLGGRNMHPIPVALSLNASFISSITILGCPAEVYTNGFMFWWITVGFFITCFGAGHIFLPIYYNLRITSVFQYLEMRFNHVIRLIAVFYYMIAMLMSLMAINLYIPSLAINAVTGLHLLGSAIVVGVVCIVYTSIGGIKAVIWTDVLQMMIMYTGMLTMVVIGSSVKGGFQNVWNIAKENDRTVLYDFDPRLRHSIWSLVIGGGLSWCNMFGTNQAQVQRAMSVGTEGRLKLAVWLNLGGMSAILLLCSVVGIVMYAFYSTCDPITFGLVSKPDQLMPLFMMDLLWETPGLPGFLLSTVFSASLSTLSPGLNALAAVTLEDFGGIKAVIWTDVLQMMIMYTGMLTMVVIGSSVKGGFQNVWNIAKENDRTVLYDFDPRLRHSIWSLVIGGGLSWCNMFGTNQAQVQRAMSVGTEGRLKLAVWLNLGGMSAILLLCSVVGIVMYAFYSTCDPITFGLVSKPDQLMPLFMMDLLWETPGLPGFLLSTVFSASLSTLSPGLNALAAVTLEDFVRPMCCKRISTLRATCISKALVVLYGLIGLGLAFVVAEIGGLILQLTMSIVAIFTGPLFGVFTLGIIFPWANRWGGMFGMITSLALMLWIGVGTMVNKVSVAPKLHVHTYGCNWNVSDTNPPTLAPTLPPGVTDPSIFDKYEGLDNLYTVSYLWYTSLAAAIVIVVGLIISFITGPTDPKTLNPKLIAPVFDICLPCLPDKIRKKLRFGVRHGEDADVLQMDELQEKMALNSDYVSEIAKCEEEM